MSEIALRDRMLQISTCFALLFITLCCTSESGKVSHLVITIPAKFSGVIRIRQANTGMEPPKAKGATVTVDLPNSCDILFSDIEWLKEWHEMTVLSGDGQKIADDPGETRDPDGRYIFDLGSNETGIHYYIGSKDGWLKRMYDTNLAPGWD